jgi:acyl carrier protein
MSDINERISRCFSNVFPDIRREDIPLASSASLSSWNSLAHVRLLSAIGEEFDLEPDMEDFEELTSWPLILSWVQKKVS